MKVMTILGTRPEIIRLSQLIKLLDKHTEHVLVHTGQNYDPRLSTVFFEELGLRIPDHTLQVQAATVGQQIGRIIAETERLMLSERPDALVILGDTNSALSCIPAKRHGIPIFHLEAGNRCFDDEVPEEVNRRIVDHTADINLPYSLHAKLNLLNEGLPHDRIFVTGSPMKELFETYADQIAHSPILERLGQRSGSYLLASMHREENVDHPRRLPELLEAMGRASSHFNRPVLLSTHPRTRKRIEEKKLEVPEGVELHEPWGFFDYVHLQKNAFCNLSDSGTIHEDAGILGIPAVVIRKVSERPEALDAASVILAGTKPDDVVRAIRIVLEQSDRGIALQTPADYADARFSERVLRIIVGRAGIESARRRLRQ